MATTIVTTESEPKEPEESPEPDNRLATDYGRLLERTSQFDQKFLELESKLNEQETRHQAELSALRAQAEEAEEAETEEEAEEVTEIPAPEPEPEPAEPEAPPEQPKSLLQKILFGS